MVAGDHVLCYQMSTVYVKEEFGGLKGLKRKEVGLRHVGRLKLLGMLRSVSIAREGN
jgi:hypothetical protein